MKPNADVPMTPWTQKVLSRTKKGHLAVFDVEAFGQKGGWRPIFEIGALCFVYTPYVETIS